MLSLLLDGLLLALGADDQPPFTPIRISTSPGPDLSLSTPIGILVSLLVVLLLLIDRLETDHAPTIVVRARHMVIGG